MPNWNILGKLKIGKVIIMKWETEKEEKAQLLSSWIDSASEELEFAKTFYKIIKKSPSKKKFIKGAREELGGYQNPWVRKELESIMNFVM